MKNLIKGLQIGLGILVVLFGGFFLSRARNGLQSSPGDKLTSSVWNQMAGNYTYSTTETDTGKKWIDGKTIYRKVLNLGAMSDANTANGRLILWGNHGIVALNTVILMQGYITNGTDTEEIGGYAGYYNSAATMGNIARCNSTQCGVQYAGAWSGYSAFLIIEYTKN